MPPAAVRSVQDLIHWRYAKITSESAGTGKRQHSLAMDLFKKLQSGDIEWPTAIREYASGHEPAGRCLYCGSAENLSMDRLLPKAMGGPDDSDNAVLACRACISSKGLKGVYGWFTFERRRDVPRPVEGKYLNLLHRLHEERGSLGAGRCRLWKPRRFCPYRWRCTKPKWDGCCLEGVLGT